MKIDTAAEQWAGLVAEITKRQQLGPAQLNEMKKAFFSGFWACFLTVTREITTLPDAVAEAEMNKLEAEMNQWWERMAAAAAASEAFRERRARRN